MSRGLFVDDSGYLWLVDCRPFAPVNRGLGFVTHDATRRNVPEELRDLYDRICEELAALWRIN